MSVIRYTRRFSRELFQHLEGARQGYPVSSPPERRRFQRKPCRNSGETTTESSIQGGICFGLSIVSSGFSSKELIQDSALPYERVGFHKTATLALPTPDALSGQGKTSLTIWWRWRESNPRPQALYLRSYMLSLPLYLTIPLPDKTGKGHGEPQRFNQSTRGGASWRSCVKLPLECSVLRETPSAQARPGQRLAVKQPERSCRRWQLLLHSLFYEVDCNLGMHLGLHHPRRSHITPTLHIQVAYCICIISARKYWKKENRINVRSLFRKIPWRLLAIRHAG